MQLSKFLKFFRSRLKTHLENVEADFEDTRSDRYCVEGVWAWSVCSAPHTLSLSCSLALLLSVASRLSSDEVYSQKDIQEVLQSLCFAVKVREANKCGC